MKFVGAVLRIAIGFILAALAAGLVQTLFVATPTELANDRERLPAAGLLVLYAATHTAIFAAPLAAIAIIIAEWLSLRGWIFYTLTAIAIAAAGFVAEYLGETGATTIFNDYALRAFLVSGFAAGIVYWLFSGRFAGKTREKFGLPAVIVE